MLSAGCSNGPFSPYATTLLHGLLLQLQFKVKRANFSLWGFREVLPVPQYTELGSKPEWTCSLGRQDHMFLLIPGQQ